MIFNPAGNHIAIATQNNVQIYRRADAATQP
jgi:hypothetical protein